MAFDTSQSSYLSLRNIIAERTNGIVFWVGSGLSVEAGLPTWSEFRNELLKSLEEKIEQLDASHNLQDIAKLKNAAVLIDKEQNNWRAFELLKKPLGATTWRARIREILRPNTSSNPPLVYKKLWQLQPHGMLTLNLDRLATRAYADVDPEPLLAEFSGNQVANYTHVLKRPHAFVCNLHGTVEDASSWILTHSELRYRLSDDGYKNFLRTCLSAKTIVFIGISADDLAVGGFVEQLSKLDIDVGEHYWLTTRRDLETSRWAEGQGVRLITYSTQNGNHSDLLEALDDLITFVSIDESENLGPIVPEGLMPTENALPPQADLLRLDAERIRQILNEEASRILGSAAPDAMEKYRTFSLAYDQAIYRAWYTSVTSEHNHLLGHQLHEEVARGAFGKVYHASDSDGNSIAVKVLHEEMRQNEELFQAFRRGVRSMKILSSHDVQGMVPYRKAFEIPAFVVMDWIDGPDLGVAVASRLVADWDLILRIGSDTANIVRKGHLLPERVLHRDIRPSNVMIRGFYSDPQNWDVVVLDFDLSWHRGALEKSVIYGSARLGYLAPEQIEDIPGVSTRHAAVDSFGLGMVLFFMLSGRDPVPEEHRHTDWADKLTRAAASKPCQQWVSTPTRFARLIQTATLNNQSERWDMTQIQAELERLLGALLNPLSTQSAELVAEEIAARCSFSEGYEWDADSLAAVKVHSSEVKLSIRGDETLRKIVVTMSWGSPGVQGKSNLGKWIIPSMNNAKSILNKRGWKIDEAQTKYAHIVVSASIHIREALANIDRAVDTLDLALDELRFS